MKRFCRILESKKLNTQILLEVEHNSDTDGFDYKIKLCAQEIGCVITLTLGGFDKEDDALKAMETQTIEGIEDYYENDIKPMFP
jgi:hypothetical protein